MPTIASCGGGGGPDGAAATGRLLRRFLISARSFWIDVLPSLSASISFFNDWMSLLCAVPPCAQSATPTAAKTAMSAAFLIKTDLPSIDTGESITLARSVRHAHPCHLRSPPVGPRHEPGPV